MSPTKYTIDARWTYKHGKTPHTQSGFYHQTRYIDIIDNIDIICRYSAIFLTLYLKLAHPSLSYYLLNDDYSVVFLSFFWENKSCTTKVLLDCPP